MMMTPSIIKQVEALAELDGMPAGLKITNRAGVVLFDSAWSAGVDYDDELFDDEDYNPQDDPEVSDTSDETSSEEDTDDEYEEYDEIPVLPLH